MGTGIGRIIKQIVGRINIYPFGFLQNNLDNIFIRKQKKKRRKRKIENYGDDPITEIFSELPECLIRACCNLH